MANKRAIGDGNVGALLDMNSMIIDERRGSPPAPPPFVTAVKGTTHHGTSHLEPLDFQTSWSSNDKYELLTLKFLTEIDRDVDSLTWSDSDDESSDMHDVPMTPATSCSDGGDGRDGQRRGVTFSSPLVTTVHTIPRLTPDLIRVLYYSRAERFFFKKQYRLEKMMAQHDDPSLAYQAEMGIVSNS